MRELTFYIEHSLNKCRIYSFADAFSTLPDNSHSRSAKMEYLEIEVYRTTPLMLDRGLVEDNRSSKVFEFATFSSPTQSLRAREGFFFLFFSLRGKFVEGYFPLFARICFSSLSVSLSLSFVFFVSAGFTLFLAVSPSSSFTSVLHTAVCTIATTI